MKKVILLLSSNTATLQHDAEILNNTNQYALILAHSTEEAIEKFQQTDIDALVLYEDISTVDKNKLSRIVHFQRNQVHILHLTEGAVLANMLNALAQEIDNASKPTYTINDDALRYAAYNITIEDAH